MKRSPAPKARGFTLIEVMVVIVIVGFAVSLVSLTLRPASKTFQRDLTALRDYLTVTQEQALFRGRATRAACLLDEQGMTCRRYTWYRDHWQREAPVFTAPGPWQWTADTAPAVRQASLSSEDRDTADFALRFLPSGEVSPLRLRIHHPEFPDKVGRLRAEDVTGVRLEVTSRAAH